MRFTTLICAPLLFLAGCQDSDAFKVGKVLVNSITETPEKITRERAASIPYATMGLELGASPEVLLILGTRSADELDWFAGDQVFVRTKGGRIIRTVGLPYDLGGLRDADISTAAAPSTGISASSQYLLDFPDLGVFGAVAQCTSREMGPDTVEILGEKLPARHLRQRCSVASMRWSFDNDYWIDVMTGTVWRSSQHVHPNSPPVVVEIFRPVQNPG